VSPPSALRLAQEGEPESQGSRRGADDIPTNQFKNSSRESARSHYTFYALVFGLIVVHRLHIMPFAMSEHQEQDDPAPEEQKIWVVCCVCNKVLQVGNIPGDKRTSHGLCTDCSQKALEQL
jgi:hypothetical protein